MEQGYSQKGLLIVLGITAIFVVIIFLIVGNSQTSTNGQQSTASSPQISELQTTQLAQIPDGYYQAMVLAGGVAQNLNSLSFSPDGSKVAYVVKENAQSVVYVNNVPGALYDTINLPSPAAFSRDSQHYVYSATNATSTVIVLDGQVIKSYPDANISDLSISPSGVPAYTFSNLGGGLSTPIKDQVVFNGHSGDPYDGIFDSKISPDGQSIAYYGCTSDNENLDTISQGYGSCNFVIQNLDGTSHPVESTLYSAGYSQAIYHSNIQFSPDGKLLVYVAHQTAQDSLVINGIQTWTTPGNYAIQNISGVTFSPDSKHIGFVVQGCGASESCDPQNSSVINGKWYIVEDNNIASPEYDEIQDLTFNYENQPSYFARTGNTWSFIINGKNIATFSGKPSNEPNIQFSKDDKNYLYAYQDASGTTLISDGNKIAQYDGILLPQFAPNGEIVFFPLNKNAKNMSLSVGGVLHPPHDLITPFFTLPSSIYDSFYQYSTDGKNIVYGAVDGQAIKVVVEPL